MNIQLSGHHVDITDGIRQAVNQRFSKIKNHYPDISDVSMALTVERHGQAVEATTQYRGITVAVHSEEQDLYVAIAEAARKMDAALAKRKGSETAQRHVRPMEQI